MVKIRLLAVMVWAVLAAWPGWAQNPQGTQDAPQAQAGTPTVKRTRTKSSVRRNISVGRAAVRTIPIETQPPSPPASAADQARQKAEDARVLQQQQLQSAQAAQINDLQVQAAQKEKDSVQKEVRIQDAPGPVQTGASPAAGTPVTPANTDLRIQDAPGPAQTLPPAAKPPQD